jgi:hypothetical protein
VQDLERRGLFTADTDRDNIVARVAVLTAARRGAAWTARWGRLPQEP